MGGSTAAVGEADPLRNLPDLVALHAREAVARAEAEVARQELKPDWSAEIMFSQRGSQFSNMVSIGVSVPLQWDKPQRQQRELAARLARVNELEAEREEQTRERVLQVQRWQQDWRAGLDRLAYLDAQRQPLATQRVDAALAAYRGGREGLGAVLQARRDALNLALERLALERETAGLWSGAAFANTIHSLRLARRTPRACTTVPTERPSIAPSTTASVRAPAITARTPDQAAIFAAANLDAIPPLPHTLPEPPATASSASSTSMISSISEASVLSRGSAVNKPGVSVNNTRTSARIMCATRAARRSLSPYRISSSATVSFSLTTGTTPSSRSRSIVSRAWRYWERREKSCGVNNT